MRSLTSLIILLWCFFNEAYAAYVIYELPQSFDMHSNSLAVQSMGGACLAQVSVQDGLPCAASMLGMVKRPRFFGTALVGNGFDAVKTTNDVLYKPMSRADLESLFGAKSRLEASGSVKLTFVAPNFAAQFAPFQASLNSIIRNSSYPLIGVHAINERALTFGWGDEKWQNILIGSHLRIFQRRFVHTEFQMFQAVTNSGGVLKPLEQSGFAFDPSLTWWFSNSGKLRWTVALENVGWVNRTYSEVPFQTQLATGIGASVPMSLGLFEFGLDARLPREGTINLADFKLGSNYRLGALQFLAGINERMLSGGVRFALKNVDLGVSYTSTRWPSGDKDEYQQSLSTQIGLGF
jgi:hypothetical protein